MIQQEPDLAGGKIRVQLQAGLGADPLFFSSFTQRAAIRFALPGLPDDRRCDRLAALLFPDHRRLTLIGDADGSHLMRGDARAGKHLHHDAGHACPDLASILLHPSRMGIIVRQFLLRHAGDAPMTVKQNGPGTRGSLNHSHDISFHAHPAFLQIQLHFITFPHQFAQKMHRRARRRPSRIRLFASLFTKKAAGYAHPTAHLLTVQLTLIRRHDPISASSCSVSMSRLLTRACTST